MVEKELDKRFGTIAIKRDL